MCLITIVVDSKYPKSKDSEDADLQCIESQVFVPNRDQSDRRSATRRK